MNTQLSEHDDEEEDNVPTPHRPPTPHDVDEDSDDDDYPAARESVGYNSRVEKILAENKDLGITIIDAGKNVEGSGGGYIVYTIRTGVRWSFSFTQAAIPKLTDIFIIGRISKSVVDIRSLNHYARI